MGLIRSDQESLKAELSWRKSNRLQIVEYEWVENDEDLSQQRKDSGVVMGAVRRAGNVD